MLLQASQQPPPHFHRQFQTNEVADDSEVSEVKQTKNESKMEVSFSAVGRQMSPSSGPDHNGNAGKSPMGNSDIGMPFSSEAAAALAAKFPNFPFHAGSLPTSGSSSILNLSSHLTKSEFDEKEYSAKKDLISQGKFINHFFITKI